MQSKLLGAKIKEFKSKFQLEFNLESHVYQFIFIFMQNKLLSAKTKEFNSNKPSKNQ